MVTHCLLHASDLISFFEIELSVGGGNLRDPIITGRRERERGSFNFKSQMLWEVEREGMPIPTTKTHHIPKQQKIFTALQRSLN